MNFLQVHKKLLIKVVNPNIWGRDGGGRDGTSAGCVRLQFEPLGRVMEGSWGKRAVRCAGWFNKPFT